MLLLNKVTGGGPTFNQGVDFRGTSGYVTDPANCDWATWNVLMYPTVGKGGGNIGWETAPTNGFDRSTSGDVRLAGINYTSSALAVMRIDLPATGTYGVQLALGDAGASNSTQVQIVDNATVLATIGTFSPTSGQWYDATGTLRTSSSAWATANPVGGGGSGQVSYTFSSTIARFKVTNIGGANVIAHIFIRSPP